MATITDPNDPNKVKDPNTDTPPTTGVQSGATPTQLPGSQPAAPPNAPASPAGTQQGNPVGTSSGRFNNISSYINANKNFNAQGGGLAGKVAGNIQQQGQQVQNQIGQAAQNFNNNAQQNRVQYDQGFVNNVVNDPTKYAQGNVQPAPVVNAATPTPAQQPGVPQVANIHAGEDLSRTAAAPVGPDTEGFNKFQNMYNANYAGPTGLENSQGLQSGVQNVQNLANAAGSENGRFGLLKQMFNNPNYSSGQQKLDNLLLQGNKGQLQQLQNTKSLAGQTSNALQQQTGAAQAQAQDYTNEAANTKNLTQAALTGAQTSADAALAAKTAAAQAGYNTDSSRLQSGLQNGQLSQGDLSTLGLNAGQNLYNLNLGDYFNTNKGQGATNQNVASAEDYARQNALARLSGNADGNKDFGDLSQAGSFAKDQFGFDKDRFNNYVAARGSAYNNQMSEADKNINDSRTALNSAYDTLKGSGVGGLTQANGLERGRWLAGLASTGQTISPQDQAFLDLYNKYGAAQNSAQNARATYNPTRTLTQT